MLLLLLFRVKRIPCLNMAHPQVADGGHGHKIWRVPVNILNKQSLTGSRLAVGRELTTPRTKNIACYGTLHRSAGLD
jgi:hypothetical protein